MGSRSLENGIPIAVEDSELPAQLCFSQIRKLRSKLRPRDRVAWLTSPRKGEARLRQDPGVLSSFPQDGEDFPSASLQSPLTFLFAHTHREQVALSLSETSVVKPRRGKPWAEAGAGEAG